MVLMLCIWVSFYLGGFFYVVVLACTDPEIKGDYVTAISSAALWPVGLYYGIIEGGGHGRG